MNIRSTKVTIAKPFAVSKFPVDILLMGHLRRHGRLRPTDRRCHVGTGTRPVIYVTWTMPSDMLRGSSE